MNNFKRLGEEEEELTRFDSEYSRRKVQSKISDMRTIGQVVELYLTKIIDLFVTMTGGDVERKSKIKRRLDDHGRPTDPRGDGPSTGPSAG